MELAGIRIPDHAAASSTWYFNHWVLGNRARRHITVRRSEAVLAAIPECPAGAKLLEVGCGPAVLSLLAARRGFVVTAVDNEPITLETGRALARENGLTIDFVHADAGKFLQSCGPAFDAVVSMEMIEHIEEWRPVVAGLAAAARPGGTVVISTPNRVGLSCVCRRMVDALGLYPYRAGYERFLRRRDVVGAMNESGLTPRAVRGILFMPPFAPDWFFGTARAVETALERVPIARELATTTVFAATRTRSGRAG